MKASFRNAKSLSCKFVNKPFRHFSWLAIVVNTLIEEEILLVPNDLSNGSEHEVQRIDGVIEVDLEHCICVNPLFDFNRLGRPLIYKIDAKSSKTAARNHRIRSRKNDRKFGGEGVLITARNLSEWVIL